MKESIQHKVWLLVGVLFYTLMLSCALGFSPLVWGKLYVATMPSFFAIPLVFVFDFPLWVWYLVVLNWIAIAVYRHEYL